ncbi:MAG: porphobilinogen synthase, partial [Chloroflexi bacterium]|nr:porphobilinogen synthase [Chloroflexota bacterium]
MAGFPEIRLRRLRRTATLRALVRETHVDVADLV